MIIVPSKVNATGSCDTKRSEMKLLWTKSGQKEENNIIFYIARNKTDIFVYQIEVNVYAGTFKNYFQHQNFLRFLLFIVIIYSI